MQIQSKPLAIAGGSVSCHTLLFTIEEQILETRSPVFPDRCCPVEFGHPVDHNDLGSHLRFPMGWPFRLHGLRGSPGWLLRTQRGHDWGVTCR